MLTVVVQTRTVELPSDSNFAIAMKNQQAAEREEQQRIKNLVLNLDLGENETEDGERRLSGKKKTILPLHQQNTHN